MIRGGGSDGGAWAREYTLTGLAKDRADPAMEAMTQRGRGGGEHEERESDRGVGWLGWEGGWAGAGVGGGRRSDLPTFMRGGVMAASVVSTAGSTRLRPVLSVRR